MWKRLEKSDMEIGMKIRVANQQAIGWDGHSIYTPQFAAGNKGIILRLNKRSVTVDIGDGNKPIYCDYKDIGVDSEFKHEHIICNKLWQNMLFLQELEKKYILLTDEDVRRHYRLMLADDIWIILNDEYGSTKYLNMNISEDKLEKIIKEVRDSGGFFGIYR